MSIAYFIFSTSSAPFDCLEQGWGTRTLNFPRQGVGVRGEGQGFTASVSEPSTAYSHLQSLHLGPR